MISIPALLQTYASLYASRLDYITPAQSKVEEGQLFVTVTANNAQWTKIIAEVETWIRVKSDLAVDASRLTARTKEDQTVVIIRQGTNQWNG